MFATRGGRAVLERALAEARLHELEVREAGQAEPPAEHEADRRAAARAARAATTSPSSTATTRRAIADRRLVEARRARVDHVGVAVRIRRARCASRTDTPRSAPRRPRAARTRPAAARRAASISRTFVPRGRRGRPPPCGHVFARRHRAARLAPERVLEEHRLDVELVRLELVEDQLRVVGAVVVADAGVVAADDEVRAAVVLAADRVPDRLARAGVAHRGRERGEHDAVGRVVAVEQDAVALDARRGGDVVATSCRRRAGGSSRPSTVSSATFVRYSCARWIGLRVWKPTTRFQPRSANAARVSAGSSASSGNGGSGRSKTVTSPAR